MILFAYCFASYPSTIYPVFPSFITYDISPTSVDTTGTPIYKLSNTTKDIASFSDAKTKTSEYFNTVAICTRLSNPKKTTLSDIPRYLAFSSNASFSSPSPQINISISNPSSINLYATSTRKSIRFTRLILPTVTRCFLFDNIGMESSSTTSFVSNEEWIVMLFLFTISFILGCCSRYNSFDLSAAQITLLLFSIVLEIIFQ